jgi:pimeloyl-ACP methyl ester carboxylesterase
MIRLSIILVSLMCYSQYAYSVYSHDQPTDVIDVDGVAIAYTEFGDKAAPSVLMVMGLMASHKVWPEALVNDLANAGYRVVLLDNRDTGDSDKLERLGEPLLWWKLLADTLGFRVSAPYALNDMANDGVAVLDALGIEKAHLIGASMGGMIAQTIASEHPDRTMGLVSIMSTTGAEHLPEPSVETQNNMTDLMDENGDRSARFKEMGFYLEAAPRQVSAILNAGDRSVRVKSISAPTLVQHGVNDTLLPPAHGEHTAELIEGSELIVYEDMGHDMPEQVLPKLTEDILTFLKRVR